MQGSNIPTGEMRLYKRHAVEGLYYPYNMTQEVDVDLYVCRTLRNVIAAVLEVERGKAFDAAQDVVDELCIMDENENHFDNLAELSEQLELIGKLADGFDLPIPEESIDTVITIGDLCKLLEGVQFGQRSGQMQSLRTRLESVMQGDKVQDRFRRLAEREAAAELEMLNAGVEPSRSEKKAAQNNGGRSGGGPKNRRGKGRAGHCRGRGKRRGNKPSAR